MHVTAYHGTTTSAATSIRSRGFEDHSKRPRWLGPGVYFYQDAPTSALRWAKILAALRGEKPIVIEAQIDLTDALDLLDIRHWDNVKRIISGTGAPERNQIGPEALFRFLNDDEADRLYHNYEDHHFFSHVTKAYVEHGAKVTAIRAAFPEGSPIHPRSWLFDLSHVQICVKNPAIINLKNSG
jgi:hypothetical protein